MPEICLVFIHIVQDTPAGASMAGNQNRLILPVRIAYQLIPECPGTGTELCDRFSVCCRLKMKRILIKVLKML